MEQVNVKASLRDVKGKQNTKKLRDAGSVPGVVYHRGEEAVAITLDNRQISKIIHDAAGENVLINLTIENETKKKSRPAIIKEVQYDPVKRYILHVDFNEISLTEKIVVDVEVVAHGEPIGVKQDGGVMDHPVRVLKVQCLPMDIPKHIDVDVSGIKLNGSIHVSDLAVSEKIKILNDPTTLLFHVKLPVEVKADEAGAEGAPEVEVIREKKEDDAKAGKEEPKKDAKSDKK